MHIAVFLRGGGKVQDERVSTKGSYKIALKKTI